MSKRTVFTTVTPLPAGITRETVMETLHCHVEMIDLNPLVEERHPIKPPPNATPEEFHCQWYSLTDLVQYLPGGLAQGRVSYNACFHDLPNGLQTHVYAPLGLNIRGKWTLGGSLPGEPIAPVELGIGTPLKGLWLREDVDMRCNFVMTSFVKGTLKKAHGVLVERLMMKAKILEASIENLQTNEQAYASSASQQENASFSRANEYDQHSLNENRAHSFASGSQNPSSPPPYGSQSPASHNSSSYSVSATSREENYNSPLHPQPLNLRNSISKTQQVVGGKAPYDNSTTAGRVSWQTLSNNGAGNQPIQRQGSNQDNNVQSHGRAGYHQENDWNQQQQTGGYPPPPSNAPPTRPAHPNGAFELE